MGRGRQKAKQTKVARKLKYMTPDTDYRALEQELTSARNRATDRESDHSDSDDAHEEDDDYSSWRPKNR